MLNVKTRIAPSTIHGIGLFAAEAIPAGTIVWEYTPSIDRLFTLKDVEQSDPLDIPTLRNYCYVNDCGDYVLCGDDARFWNFSENPNCDIKHSHHNPMARQGEHPVITVRAIARGEEMTISFRSDGDHKRKLGI
jgi:hypothetical protein